MFLYDRITPALDDGDYRLTVSTRIADTWERPLHRYFSVDGPRFNLAPTEVAGVYPPRNARGVFQFNLPQIVLNRRTLPWERELDIKRPIPGPTVAAGDPPPIAGKAPWVALLVFEDGDDYQLLQNVPLDRVVPADVYARLGSPAGIACDAVEVDGQLLAAILPSKEELKLLAHVRQVNVADRELEAASGDGFYAVVIANRLPGPGKTCRACLVSLEERSDLVPANPPAEASQVPLQPPRQVSPPREEDGAGLAEAGRAFVGDRALEIAVPPLVLDSRERLVLLHSWQFTCDGPGRFRELMQNLDVALFGSARPGGPDMIDSGHLVVEMTGRTGEAETALYRGPLVALPLTRDTHGPYHSADQARRVTAETGLEDVTYAAAFEVGRLLAAADAQLAQEILRWRRGAYHRSLKDDLIAALRTRFHLPIDDTLAARLVQTVTPVVASTLLARVVAGTGPLGDPYGLRAIARVVGLQPAQLATAWGMTPADTTAMLDGSGATGSIVPGVSTTPRANTTLDAVAASLGTANPLTAARTRAIDAARLRSGGGK
jgi:hypothetical protein